jgi:hypothetical protein
MLEAFEIIAQIWVAIILVYGTMAVMRTVAVARKLAVILHRMWIDRTEFNWSKKEVAA